jgi:hypothetical protein
LQRAVLALAAACLAGVAGCAGEADTSDISSSADSYFGDATTPSAAPPQPDRILCQVTSTGTYFLWVTSGTVHNFSACDGATRQPLNAQPFDFSPTVDLRCTSSDANIAADQAMIGVYSSTEPADLEAAKKFCTSRGMTMK